MTSILVTGGAGFIGSHIVELALEQGHRVTVIDNLSTGKIDNIQPFFNHPAFTFVEADICKAESYEHLLKDIDAVIHCAARISVAESMSHPELYQQTNVLGTELLINKALANDVKAFVFSSTAAIYGDNPQLPKLESMQPEPKSPYADSKLATEQLLAELNKSGAMRTVCLRYFNVFGPRQDPHSSYAAAMPHFIDQAVANKDMTIFGDGEQTRDFVYVKDVAKANLLATENGNGIINVARGDTITITELAQQIKDCLHSDAKILYGSERAGDIKHSQADIHQLQSQWPQFKHENFVAAMNTTIQYYKNR